MPLPRALAPVAVVLLLVPGCGRKTDLAAVPDTLSTRPVEFESTALGFKLQLPPAWRGHHVAIERTGGEGEQVYPSSLGSVQFDYQPQAAGLAPVTLLSVVVYERSDWEAVLDEPGPPAGERLATVGDRVYVLVQAQPDPYDPASADGRAFEGMRLPFSEVKAAFTATGQAP